MATIPVGRDQLVGRSDAGPQAAGRRPTRPACDVYVSSVFVKPFREQMNWPRTGATLPFTVVTGYASTQMERSR